MTKTISRRAQACATMGVIALLSLCWHPLMNSLSSELLDGSMESSIAIFAGAKLLNGAISLIQSIDLSLQFIGGIGVSPGELLDPLNDIVETFSWVALAALVSIAMQHVLLGMSGHFAINTILSLGVVWWLSSTLWARVVFPTAAKKLVAILLIIRFAVPVAVLLNEGIEQTFLQPEIDAAYQRLESTPTYQTATLLNADIGSDELDILVEQAKETISKDTEVLSNSIVSLMVAFLLKSMIFPLLCLWLFVQSIKKILLEPK